MALTVTRDKMFIGIEANRHYTLRIVFYSFGPARVHSWWWPPNFKSTKSYKIMIIVTIYIYIYIYPYIVQMHIHVRIQKLMKICIVFCIILLMPNFPIPIYWIRFIPYFFHKCMSIRNVSSVLRISIILVFYCFEYTNGTLVVGTTKFPIPNKSLFQVRLLKHIS